MYVQVTQIRKNDSVVLDHLFIHNKKKHNSWIIKQLKQNWNVNANANLFLFKSIGIIDQLCEVFWN